MDHATNGVVGQRGPTSGVPLLAVASLDALSFPREDIQSPERFACNTSRLLGYARQTLSSFEDILHQQ